MYVCMYVYTHIWTVNFASASMSVWTGRQGGPPPGSLFDSLGLEAIMGADGCGRGGGVGGRGCWSCPAGSSWPGVLLLGGSVVGDSGVAGKPYYYF